MVTWKEDFLRSEAKEVVDAVGAWVYCFRTDADGKITEIVEETMKAIQEITEKHNVYGNDAAMLAVAMLPAGGRMSQDANSSEAQEDTCMQYGFEYILASAQGKNEFGEKVGVERLKEALEANEWSARDDEDDALGLEELDLEGDDDDTFGGFSTVEAEMTSELFGMKAALVGDDFESEPFAASPEDDESAQVEDLDRIMGRILAIKGRHWRGHRHPSFMTNVCVQIKVQICLRRNGNDSPRGQFIVCSSDLTSSIHDYSQPGLISLYGPISRLAASLGPVTLRQ